MPKVPSATTGNMDATTAAEATGMEATTSTMKAAAMSSAMSSAVSATTGSED